MARDCEAADNCEASERVEHVFNNSDGAVELETSRVFSAQKVATRYSIPGQLNIEKGKRFSILSRCWYQQQNPYSRGIRAIVPADSEFGIRPSCTAAA
jgi:hypothetical protein